MDPYGGPTKIVFISYESDWRETSSDYENVTGGSVKDLLRSQQENEASRAKIVDSQFQEDRLRMDQNFHTATNFEEEAPAGREQPIEHVAERAPGDPAEQAQPRPPDFDIDPQRFRDQLDQYVENVRESEEVFEDVFVLLDAQAGRADTRVPDIEANEATQHDVERTKAHLRREIQRSLHTLQLLKQDNHELRARNNALECIQSSSSAKSAAAKNEHLEQEDIIRNLRGSLSRCTGMDRRSSCHNQPESERARCSSGQSTPRTPVPASHSTDFETTSQIESLSESFQRFFTPPSNGSSHAYLVGSDEENMPRQQPTGQCSLLFEGSASVSDGSEYHDGRQNQQTRVPEYDEDILEESHIEASNVSPWGHSLKRKRRTSPDHSNKRQLSMEYGSSVEETPFDSYSPCKEALAAKSALPYGSNNYDAEGNDIVSGLSAPQARDECLSRGERDGPSQSATARSSQPDDQSRDVTDDVEVISIIDVNDLSSSLPHTLHLTTDEVSRSLSSPEEVEIDIPTGDSNVAESHQTSPLTSSDHINHSDEGDDTDEVQVSQDQTLEQDSPHSQKPTVHRSSAEVQARTIEQTRRSRTSKGRNKPQQTSSSAPAVNIAGGRRRHRRNQTPAEKPGNPHPEPSSESHGSDSENGGIANSVHADTDEQLKKDIQASYTRFGSETNLFFRYGRGGFSPNAVDMNSNWKRRSQLNQSSWQKLASTAEEIAASFPKDTGLQPKGKEARLIRRLCRAEPETLDFPSSRSIAHSLYADRDLSKDESHLAEFECYSVLMISQQIDQAEFETTTSELDDYKQDVLQVYQSLHSIINHLHPAWNNVHTLVAIYILRAGLGRLSRYFASSTRPAAIELLIKTLNEPKYRVAGRRAIDSMLGVIGIRPEIDQRLHSPLLRITKLVDKFVEPDRVRLSLGYSQEYQSRLSTGGSEIPLPTPQRTPGNRTNGRDPSLSDTTSLPSAGLAGDDSRRQKRKRQDSLGCNTRGDKWRRT